MSVEDAAVTLMKATSRPISLRLGFLDQERVDSQPLGLTLVHKPLTLMRKLGPRMNRDAHGRKVSLEGISKVLPYGSEDGGRESAADVPRSRIRVDPCSPVVALRFSDWG